MDEDGLERVNLNNLSSIRHETFVSDSRSLIPDYLVVSYHGCYRDGTDGRGDALYIVATCEAARKAWYSSCTIVDFRSLRYDWGDEMEWITSIGWDRVVQVNEPLVIVVGDGCRPAMRSLLDTEYPQFCVETLEEAIELGRRKSAIYKQALKNFRP